MSDMKCPFCNTPLVHENMSDYWCVYCNTQEQKGLYGSDKLWQELINERQHATDCQDLFIAAMAQKIDVETELERTRKALEIAVDALDRMAIYDSIYDIIARNAMKRIKELEQKQPTFVHNKIEFPEFNDNLLEEFDKQFFENGQDDDLTETALEQKEQQ